MGALDVLRPRRLVGGCAGQILQLRVCLALASPDL